MAFTDTLRLRSLTEPEITALPAETRREFARIQQFAEQVYQRGKGQP
jgi:hypothetical protein